MSSDQTAQSILLKKKSAYSHSTGLKSKLMLFESLLWLHKVWQVNVHLHAFALRRLDMAVNSPWLQIFRTDREVVIDDVIMHDTWCYLCKKMLIIDFDSDGVAFVSFDPISLLPTNHIVILQGHTGVCKEMFNVNTSNSWHYSCPHSVCCRSTVFLVVV